MNKIDFKFISKLEGKSLKGYVPDPDHSQSGVTIASGFDLGCRSIFGLEATFTKELSEKLVPYVGMTGNTAKRFLEQNPLLISEKECEQINGFAHLQASNNLEHAYKSATGKEFYDLSRECQTVVASVSFQYGSLSLKCPNFWRQVTNGEWVAAWMNLLDFGDRYQKRRSTEAYLLKSWIDKTLKG